MQAHRGPDPLSPDERARLLAAPRLRRLPILGSPTAPTTSLAGEARAIDVQSRPRIAVWELTLACDLSCRHCGSRAGAPREGELSTEECLDLATQLAELGVMEVSLIGGEVYLREDWTTIARELRRLGMEVSVATGGQGFTDHIAEDAIRAGVQSVSLSIDGLEATHDRLRGKPGAFSAALRGMRALRRAGMRVACNSQINRLSMPELPELLEVCIDEGAHSWQIALTVAMGRAVDEPEILLQPYDLLQLFPMLGALKSRCDDAGITLWPGNNIGYFGPYESHLRGGLPRGHLNSCGAGRATIGIEADGTIKGCPSLPTEAWAGGNVREHRLRDIWEKSAPLRYTRDRTIADLWGFCRTCYYADVCRAGCTWTSFVLFGKAGNNPYCHHRALELDAQGRRECIVRVEEAPGSPFDHGKFEIHLESTR